MNDSFAGAYYIYVRGRGIDFVYGPSARSDSLRFRSFWNEALAEIQAITARRRVVRERHARAGIFAALARRRSSSVSLSDRAAFRLNLIFC